MPHGNDAADYLSFLRGYAAAMNHSAFERGQDSAEAAWEPAAYSEGFAVGSRAPEYTLRYRDLSTGHSSTSGDRGSFSGTLERPA